MDDEPSPLTEEQRRTARAMAGLGVSRRHIAKYLRMDEAQLAACLGDELDQAEVEATSKVAQALFTMATKQNNVAAAIFWMKARGGWREKQEIEANINGVVQQRYVISAPAECATAQEWMDQCAPKNLR